MSDHYFEFDGDRTDVDSFHAAAILERQIQKFNVDGSGVTRNLSYVCSTEAVGAPVVLSIVYSGGHYDDIVDYLNGQDGVVDIEVFENELSIRCEVDGR